MLRMQREVESLQQLRSHPNIIHLEDVFWVEHENLVLLLEWADGGELFDYVHQRRRVNEAEAKAIFSQIISAVQHIHDSGRVHRDLKLENILLRSDGPKTSPQVLISDFGFARPFCAGEALRTACGSPCYAAPELVTFQKGAFQTGYQGPPADIWSCGVILYAMLVGYLPFESEAAKHFGKGGMRGGILANVPSLYQYIRDVKAAFKLPADLQLSFEALDLLHWLLSLQPEARPTAVQILEHPWLKTATTYQ